MDSIIPVTFFVGFLFSCILVFGGGIGIIWFTRATKRSVAGGVLSFMLFAFGLSLFGFLYLDMGRDVLQNEASDSFCALVRDHEFENVRRRLEGGHDVNSICLFGDIPTNALKTATENKDRKMIGLLQSYGAKLELYSD